MAFYSIKAYSSFIKPMQKIFPYICSHNNNGCLNGNIQNLIKQPIRSTSFFNRKSSDTLWKSVISVSNAGKQRGRARGNRGKYKNLNKGQVIGIGKINMLWPGLTGPIMQGGAVLKQEKRPPDPEREAKLQILREKLNTRKRKAVHPLNRAWTGGRLGGKKIGPPDPVTGEAFTDFETIILEHKSVNHMTGNMGRKRSYSTFVITGNKNGICGIALGKAMEVQSALRLAKNKAGFRLMHIPLYNKTIYHDFFSQFGSSKVFVTKKYEGYGLVCQRAIKAACEVIGITDIHVKIEGAINYQHIIKAFLIGLLQQKTHKQLAEEKKLHLVELRQDKFMYPKVLASPSVLRTPAQIPSTEILDLKEHVLDGKVILNRIKYPPFYADYDSYKIRLKKMEYLRNQNEVRLRMYAEHGELRSFLTDKYPEAKPSLWRKKKNTDEEQLN